MEYLSMLYDGFGSLLPFMAFLVIFVLIIIAVNLIGSLLKKVIDWTPLGMVDNIAGAVLGVLKWAIGISVIFWVIGALQLEFITSAAEKSKILPVTNSVLAYVADFITALFLPLGVYRYTQDVSGELFIVILIVDNFDSFTYNLVDYFEQLEQVVNVQRNTTAIEQLIEMNCDALVLSPGPGQPREAGKLMQIIDYFHNKLPILGICLGHQAIAAYFNAALSKAIRPMHGKNIAY
jgi:uncharacterized membrane protein required for colicin V production